MVISVWTNSLTWICVSLIVLIISVIVFAYFCRTTLKAEPELSPLSPSGPGYSSNLHNVDNLKLCAMIGQGKYGTVWKGMINETPVAVKIFPSHHKQYFINEKNIYSVSLMDCPSLLEYYGKLNYDSMPATVIQKYFLIFQGVIPGEPYMTTLNI